MRVFDADETAGDQWIDGVDAFAQAIVGGLIPVAIPGRVALTASCLDATTRARLAIGLALLARARIARELAAEGVVPA